MGFKRKGKYIPTDKRKLTHDEMIKMGIRKIILNFFCVFFTGANQF